MTATIRRARTEEADALSALALRSKAHWGYDQAFLAACKDELTVSQTHIDDGDVWVAVDETGLAGFYRLCVKRTWAEVELLFVRPDAIGTGIGRALWTHMIAEAETRGAHRVCVDSDPGAEGFYRAMDCRRIGDAPSVSIADRVLPRLECRLTEMVTT
jgi:GNAT superfamily N-acetyltransferase